MRSIGSMGSEQSEEDRLRRPLNHFVVPLPNSVGEEN